MWLCECIMVFHYQHDASPLIANHENLTPLDLAIKFNRKGKYDCELGIKKCREYSRGRWGGGGVRGEGRWGERGG